MSSLGKALLGPGGMGVAENESLLCVFICILRFRRNLNLSSELSFSSLGVRSLVVWKAKES